MESDRPKLVVVGGPDEDEQIPLKATNSLGRAPGNDVIIAEDGVSRRHAEIVETEQGYTLRDLTSTNGTFVNQQRITSEEHILNDGDQVSFGGGAQKSFVFRHLASATVEAPPVAPTPIESAADERAVEEPAADTGAVPLPAEQAESPEPAPAEMPPAEPVAADEVEPTATAEPARVHPAAVGTVGEPAPPIMEAAPVAAGPAEPPVETPAPPQSLLAKVLAKLRGPGEPKAPVDEEAPYTPPEEIGPESLPTLARIARTFRRLREDLRLSLRHRTLALSTEDSVIRAVVFEEDEVVAWGIADPKDGDPFYEDPYGEEHEDVDVARVSHLLSGLRADRSRVVTDLPLYTPLHRSLKLPKLGRRYINAVVQSEVASTIPFTQNEVDIVWQLEEVSEDAQQVTAIAVQKREIDDHVQRLVQSGYGPLATYSQAAALAAAVGVQDAMVVHLTLAQSAVVLIRGGEPRAVHKVAPVTGEEGQSPQGQAEALARAVERMEGYDATLRASEGGRRLPVVLTGQVPGDGQLEIELRNMTGREIVPASPPVTSPEDFPVVQYATNVGLALLDRGRRRAWRRAPRDGPVSPSLLSKRHVPAPVPIEAIAVFAVLGLFAVGALYITPRVNEVSADAVATEQTLVNKERENRMYTIQLGGATKLQGDARDVRGLTLELRSRIDALRGEMETLGTFFEKIETITETTRPEDVKIADLKPLRDEFTLSGKAPTFAHALQYADNIRNSGIFVDVSVREVSGGLAAGTEASSLESILSGVGATTEQTGSGEGVKFVIKATAISSLDDEGDEPSE